MGYTSTAVTLTDLTDTVPVLGGSGAAQATDDQHTATPLSVLTVTDPDAGQTQTATVSFAAANGTFSGLGTAAVSNGMATHTVTAAATAVKTALQGAVFTPTADQVTPGATVQTVFTVNDTDSTGAAAATPATATLTTTSVNDWPQVGGTRSGQTTSDHATINPFAGVTVSDPDTGQGETVTVTLSKSSNGTLSGGGFAQTANLGRFSDSTTSAFHQAYDSLSLTDATAKAYAAIFGTTPTADKVSATSTAWSPTAWAGWRRGRSTSPTTGPTDPTGSAPSRP